MSPTPDIPIMVEHGVRQGDEPDSDTTMPGSEGFSRSYRGRGRNEVPLYGQGPKGHMIEKDADA